MDQLSVPSCPDILVKLEFVCDGCCSQATGCHLDTAAASRSQLFTKRLLGNLLLFCMRHLWSGGVLYSCAHSGRRFAYDGNCIYSTRALAMWACSLSCCTDTEVTVNSTVCAACNRQHRQTWVSSRPADQCHSGMPPYDEACPRSRRAARCSKNVWVM